MYIEEVIIEGFKSYATRTVIGKWDPRFNAITGLNGTGKSNILDSICFVLGITNLSHVRATNLQDLVYKKGQAGINKASVTIVFNNDDKNKSPPKYINCPKIIITRQIIIGGKNKYLINSKNETQETVSDMFHSVQLNIQNPNFLIMQGKITQVLNMKPSQILGMVEEAAGTRLYEDRKNKALKAIEKKDGKLEHSALLLETEIIPKLEELREKKRVLLEFQKVNSEKERLEKVVVAYDYTFQTNQIEKFKEKKITNDERKKHLNSMKSILGQEIAELEEEVNQVTADRAKNGGAYFEIEEQLKVVNKEMAKLKTQHTLKSQTIKDEVENIKIIDQNVTDLCQSLETSKLKTEDLMNQSKTTMLEFTNKQKYINETENLFQTLTTGLSAKEGQENGYLNQLSVAKQEQNNCSSEIQQLKLRLSHLQEEIKVEEPKAKIARKENASLLAELESNKNILQMINSELNCISFDPSLEQGLVEKKTNLQQKLAEVENRIEKLERSMNSFEFKYSDPCENFDRSKVKGLVATLITIPKEHLNKANALEVCAGGKLYQVVVEDEKVGSLLIEKGKLQKRVTIIPLNKISDFKVQAERIATAKQLAPGAVDLALSLIGSDSEVQKAMNFVFGNTLICRDPSVSKKVTFDKRVNMRSVTLDGDVYDPSGQLTGGARSNSSGSLLKLQNLQQLQAEASTLQIAFKRAESELHDFQSQKQLLTKMKENKTLKEHELKLLEERMNNNPHFRVIQNVEQLIQRHKETKESIQTSKEKLVKLNEKIVSIEKEMSELNDDRDTKLKSLQNQIKQAKKELARLEPLASQMEQNILLSKEDSVQLELEIEKVKLQSTNANQLLSQLKSEYSQIESELKIVEAKQNQWLVKLNEEKSVLASFDKELQALEKSFKIKNQQLEDVKLEIQKLVSETSSIAESLQKAEKSLNHLVKSHTWIEDQKQ
ncbi:hypothetical protein BC833DRAFT_190008 [Globomyces pollinis-pini]|nr:hypothetical protein BC833DRAFT_190008 [Globomyces pollinis-pini]